MITVRQIDQLVIADDTVAARLWTRLGPRVRQAYTADRDAWVVARRKVDAGETLPAATLAAQHKVFTGWARALHAASSRPKRTPPRSASPSGAAPVAAAAAATAAEANLPVQASPSAPAAPPLAVPAKSTGGAGTAVAGGLLLAGLIAVAARRKST